MPDVNIPPISDPNASAAGEVAEVIVYQDAGFQGQQKRTTEGWSFPQDSFWNDQISSIIVIRGKWRFFVDSFGRASM